MHTNVRTSQKYKYKIRCHKSDILIKQLYKSMHGVKCYVVSEFQTIGEQLSEMTFLYKRTVTFLFIQIQIIILTASLSVIDLTVICTIRVFNRTVVMLEMSRTGKLCGRNFTASPSTGSSPMSILKSSFPPGILLDMEGKSASLLNLQH